MHVEHLDWLANNPRYTQRFATHVGKLCRDMPNKAVAEMERLHHTTVKDLDKLYMQEQVERAGLPAPRAIGIDEISIRKGHNPNRKIFEARKRETAALGAGEKLVLGHPLAATIGDSARCMQNLEKVLFTGPKTSDTVTFICD